MSDKKTAVKLTTARNVAKKLYNALKRRLPLFRNTLYRIIKKEVNTFLESSSNIAFRLAYNVKVKFSRYRPGVAQRVGRGIALLFLEEVSG